VEAGKYLEDDLVYSPRRLCSIAAMPEHICITCLSHRQRNNGFNRGSIYSQFRLNWPMLLENKDLARFEGYIVAPSRGR
jgi:hypothetical protein